MKSSFLTKFSLAAFLLIAVIAVGLAWGIQQQMEQNALRQAAVSAADQVATILNPNLKPADLTGPLDPARFDEIDRLIQQNIPHEHIVRIKIWNRDGLLLYSDEKTLVGRSFPISKDLEEALDGEIAMDISSLKKEENVGEREHFARLLEVYVPLHPMNSPQVEGAYEIYYDIAVLESSITETRHFVWSSVGIGFLLLYGSLFTLARNASRDLIHRNEENRRLYEETKQLLAERIRAEEALRESEERYRTIIEYSNDMIWTLDTYGRFLFMNKRFEELTGLRLVEWKGKNFAPLIVEEDLTKGVEMFHKTLNNQHQQYEVSVKSQEGRIVILSVNTAPMYSGGEIVGAVSFGRDITELRKAEEIRIENERLAYASKAKSEFLASMSHELRTPLNTIIGFSELLQQKVGGGLNEKQDRYIANVLTSSKFLLNLINDILDLSKVETGKIELVIEKISVPETLNETITLIKERAAKHNALIETDLDPQLEFIEADKQRLKQILFNLLSNAMKFSKKEGGTTTITTKKIEDMAQISVSDTGIGIKEEDLGKLFKEFSQANPGISKEYGGTGLGLAISKKLVELHGGKIVVKSKFGEGTTFTFFMPLMAKKT